MLKVSNNSNTIIFVLHEIYGINDQMELVCEQFSTKGYDVACPNLANITQSFAYNQTRTAYNHFIKEVGFVEAAQKIKTLLKKAKVEYKYVFLVGYSIGATVAWLCSEESNICDGTIGYYGSRIRDYADLLPKCPVLLFFPSKEKTLNNEELIFKLEKANIDISVLKGEHGFCNPFGGKYNEESCKLAKEQVDVF